MVGICGEESKCRWLEEELGFDVALNYKAADFEKRFREETKSYIDVYFDNGEPALVYTPLYLPRAVAWRIDH